jgi:hypothetical protein
VAIGIAQQWRAFRSDSPGHRFENHYKRMREGGSRAGAILQIALGAILALAGVVLLFVPGPGLLVVLFGLGLLGGQSRALAGVLDRVEPRLRAAGRTLQRWWHARSMIAQDLLIAGAVCLLGAACYGGYCIWLA